MPGDIIEDFPKYSGLLRSLGVHLAGVTVGQPLDVPARDIRGKAAVVGRRIMTIPSSYIQETTD